MRPEPKELQIYKHFKGNLYQIVTIAIHSETAEKLVVYRPLYKDGKVFARPLGMFMSEVDHAKYPDVEQKYRFELMCEDGDSSESAEESVVAEPVTTATESESSPAPMDTASINVESCSSAADAQSDPFADENAGLDPLLEKFLDAEDYEQKLDVFYLMKKKATRSMLSYVAMSLDIEVSKEDIDEQYMEILNCLKTLAKFECNRLRPSNNFRDS